MSTADLSGIPIQEAHITLPYFGIWHADIRLVSAASQSIIEQLSGPQTLNYDTMSLPCDVVRAITFVGGRGVRVVGSVNTAGVVGRWATVVPGKQYHSAGGLSLSTVLMDVAAGIGEQVRLASDSVIGTDYIRTNGPASRVLNDLIGVAWWMDPATGIINTAARASTAITSNFTAHDVQGSSGIYHLSAETVADWVPGRTFANTFVSGTISRVVHHVTPTELRLEVMSVP